MRDRTYRIVSSSDMVSWVQENAASIIGDGSTQSFAVNTAARRKFICVQVKRGLLPFP